MKKSDFRVLMEAMLTNRIKDVRLNTPSLNALTVEQLEQIVKEEFGKVKPVEDVEADEVDWHKAELEKVVDWAKEMKLIEFFKKGTLKEGPETEIPVGGKIEDFPDPRDPESHLASGDFDYHVGPDPEDTYGYSDDGHVYSEPPPHVDPQSPDLDPPGGMRPSVAKSANKLMNPRRTRLNQVMPRRGADALKQHLRDKSKK